MPTTLITGASSGIGRALAQLLAHEGHDLLLTSRRADELARTAALCRDNPGRIETLRADIAKPEDCRRLIDAAQSRLGRLDHLVNNAGQGRVLSIPESTPELLEETYATNTLSAARLIHLAWPLFQRQHAATAASASPWRGTVINVSSMATIDPFPGFFAYAGSKAALNLIAASVAKEGAALGLRAFAIAPGAVETPMLRAVFDESIIPRDQTLDPADVARVIADCIAGRRDQHNGRTIPVLSPPAKAWYEEHLRAHPPLTS